MGRITRGLFVFYVLIRFFYGCVGGSVIGKSTQEDEFAETHLLSDAIWILFCNLFRPEILNVYCVT